MNPRPRSFHRFNLYLTDLSWPDRCACRRHYRILRIAMYAPQNSPYAKHGMYQGCYGMHRVDARRFLRDFYNEISQMSYIGSK